MFSLDRHNLLLLIKIVLMRRRHIACFIAFHFQKQLEHSNITQTELTVMHFMERKDEQKPLASGHRPDLSERFSTIGAFFLQSPAQSGEWRLNVPRQPDTICLS